MNARVGLLLTAWVLLTKTLAASSHLPTLEKGNQHPDRTLRMRTNPKMMGRLNRPGRKTSSPSSAPLSLPSVAPSSNPSSAPSPAPSSAPSTSPTTNATPDR